jgi:hypothetical protein
VFLISATPYLQHTTSGVSLSGLGGKTPTVYNLCKVKTDISVVLTVKSGLDSHMINELEDELNHEPCLWFWIFLYYIYSLSFNVGWYILIL